MLLQKSEMHHYITGSAAVKLQNVSHDLMGFQGLEGQKRRFAQFQISDPKNLSQSTTECPSGTKQASNQYYHAHYA